ncbi:RodZ domain-containing protein [Halomonas sp. LS-001]
MSDTYTSEQHDQPFTMSPGEQLKRRREQLDISLEEAADALHLRPAVITGLEHDSYDEIPVPTYRRGYLRAYARYLDIDEGPVLDAYKARNGTQEADRKVTPVSISRPPSRLGALLFKLVTLLVIIGLITVTVMWWQSRGGSTPPGLEDTGQLSTAGSSVSASNVSTGNVSDNNVSDNNVSDNNVSDNNVSDNNVSADNVASDSTADRSTDSAARNGQSGSADTASNEASERNAATMEAASDEDDASTADAGVQEDDAAASASSETTAADETAADETPQDDAAVAATIQDTTDAEETATADESNARLELTFNQQSWTEIFDATNQRVFVGLQEPGTSATVEGEPPYRLTIGNSTGVELRYRGEVVNLRERAGANNVARFTLGE